MNRAIYIEKKDGVTKHSVTSMITGIRIDYIREETFTIEGTDITFVAVYVKNATPEKLRDLAEQTSPQHLYMYSGVVESALIQGVVRHGNCLYGYISGQEPHFLETDVLDNRCKISFPLVTKRLVDRKIRFLPLDLEMPTDWKTVDRRIKSMLAFEKGNELDFVREISSFLAIASLLYPSSLLWKEGRVPDPVEAMCRVSALPFNSMPAYYIMTEEERVHLHLDLYLGFQEQEVREHLKPMSQVIPATVMRDIPQDVLDGIMSGTVFDQFAEISDVEDLNRFVASYGRNFLKWSAGGKEVTISRNGDKVQITREDM